MFKEKPRILVVGAGGVGTMAAYAIQIGGKAEITAVLRSNFDVVARRGFNISSVDHGHYIKGWRPMQFRKTIPNVIAENIAPFDFIVVATKNVPDVSPTAAQMIEPAVSPGKTAIVLIQNGLNIEQPFIARFPANPIISSVSMIGASETEPGNILHNDADSQKIGPFYNPHVPHDFVEAAVRRYIEIYNACGKLDIVYEPDTAKARWGKLVYNASFNSTAAVLRIDTTRMRMSEHIVNDLVWPIMVEIMAAANAQGVQLPQDLPERLIRNDPLDIYFKPSMFQDIERGNFLEFENIVGEPLREGEAKGIPMPTLKVMYGLLKALQLKVKESKGMWAPVFKDENPYQQHPMKKENQ